MYCLRLGLELLRSMWGSATDLRPIADEVGAGVFRELDFHQEAANALEFERRLAFLGFVRSPRWEPEFTGPKGRARLLAMEWVEGKKLHQLDPPAQLRMVNMAVQASVAQLIRTGFVHADPHAGNLLVDEEGRLVFLDFGLMCRVRPPRASGPASPPACLLPRLASARGPRTRAGSLSHAPLARASVAHPAQVEPYIMEAFASGICHLLAGDWLGLAYDFRDIGLAPATAFEKRNPATMKYEACSPEEFAAGVQRALLAEEDGQTRFGALATGLGGLSSEFKFLCPPFIILLCRTFLTLEARSWPQPAPALPSPRRTLESHPLRPAAAPLTPPAASPQGMADVVDPNFSIYTQALPFAVRRALSPETEKGEQTLRSALLTETGEFRFNRLMQLLARGRPSRACTRGGGGRAPS